MGAGYPGGEPFFDRPHGRFRLSGQRAYHRRRIKLVGRAVRAARPAPGSRGGKSPSQKRRRGHDQDPRGQEVLLCLFEGRHSRGQGGPSETTGELTSGPAARTICPSRRKGRKMAMDDSTVSEEIFEQLSDPRAPLIATPPPGPKSQEYLEYQRRHESLAVSYPRGLPMAMPRGRGDPPASRWPI